MKRRFVVLLTVALLGGCASAPKPESPTKPPSRPGYYLDDGPGDNTPSNLDTIPEPIPRAEPLHRFANRPYVVFGREYVPATSLRPYRERGVASWYGRKFHGEKTAIGEVYDMYGLTAAHPTLPLPSFARVTSVASGKSVVVRVNDRGPFLHDRLIDLSYAAAHRIGIAQRGSGEVIVEAILPGAATMVAAAPLPPVAAAPAAPQVALPSVSPATAAAPEPIPVQPAPSGYTVQLGAFASNANALNFLDHAKNQLANAEVEPRIRQVDGLYRVYVGPYADRDEARRVAARLAQAFGFATTLTPH